jgi:hypothetical protein
MPIAPVHFVTPADERDCNSSFNHQDLKSWIVGTQHGVERKHLVHYLNEFVSRFNRRKTPMAAFQSLLSLAAVHRPTTYNQLYGPESTG